MTTLLTTAAATGHLRGPHIDWGSFMPFVVLGTGALIVLLAGLVGGREQSGARARIVPLITLMVLAAFMVIGITRFHHPASIIAGALAVDDLALILDMIFAVAAIACVLLSVRSPATESAGHGEYYSLLLFSVLGMAVLVSARTW
jgi:NADH-quinone oxidoreductase subunit N